MDGGTIFVETIRVLLSAPVVFGGLILYFLWKYNPVIGGILKRLSSVSLPGGVKLDMMLYDLLSSPLDAQASLPPPDTGRELPAREEAISADFENDFRGFLLKGIKLHLTFILVDTEILWKEWLTPARLLANLPEANTVEERLKAMKIEERPIQEYSVIKGASTASSTKELMSLYNKALLLHEFLTRQRDWNK